MYSVATAAARSQLLVNTKVVRRLVTIQIIRQIIVLARDLFLAPSIIQACSKQVKSLCSKSSQVGKNLIRQENSMKTRSAGCLARKLLI